MKKALISLGAVVLLLVLTASAVLLPAFAGIKPMVDGATYEGGTTQVVEGFVSMYLLPAGDGAYALIDCGNDPDGKAILAALKAKGVGPQAVKAVFITHGHPDHIAACHLFTSAEVYAFAGDVKLASGEERAKGLFPSLFALPKEKAVKVTRTLTDGASVSVGPLTVKAYNVPGHTAGSAAYLANGVLFLGDSSSARSDGKTVKAAPWIFSDDVEQNLASLKKLYARLKEEHAEVRTLAFAHSASVEGLEALTTVAK